MSEHGQLNPEPVSVTSPRTRRARRPAQSCEPCRRRKVRCDLGTPCSACRQSRGRMSCTYSSSARHIRRCRVLLVNSSFKTARPEVLALFLQILPPLDSQNETDNLGTDTPAFPRLEHLDLCIRRRPESGIISQQWCLPALPSLRSLVFATPLSTFPSFQQISHLTDLTLHFKPEDKDEAMDLGIFNEADATDHQQYLALLRNKVLDRLAEILARVKTNRPRQAGPILDAKHVSATYMVIRDKDMAVDIFCSKNEGLDQRRQGEPEGSKDDTDFLNA